MKTEDIKNLLNAFYEAETSPEQELRLLHYFESEELSPLLIADKELFIKLYKANDELQIPPSLDPSLGDWLNQLAKEEASFGQQSLQKKLSIQRKLWLWTGSIAAGISILLAGSLSWNTETPTTANTADNTPTNSTTTEEENRQIKDTFTDPEEAYREARKILLLVSTNINKGTDQLALVSAQMDSVNRIINRNMNILKYKKI